MFSKLKGFGAVTLASCVFSLPLTAQANLTIENQTAFPSTCKINNQHGDAQCSSTIPTYGVTQAHTINSIPHGIIWGGCLANLHNCTAEVYMTDNCTGPIVATAVFDITTGIKNIASTPEGGQLGYTFEAMNPFYIKITG